MMIVNQRGGTFLHRNSNAIDVTTVLLLIPWS